MEAPCARPPRSWRQRRTAADDEEGPGVLAAGLSAVYAQSQVLGKAGNPENVKNVNFLLSSFLKEEQMVDLVMTYQVKTVVGGVKIRGFSSCSGGA